MRNMDLKKYKKTRYQNIYKSVKSGNYVVMINKPVKTSISRINGEKIFKIEEALKVRDNPKIKLQKKAEIVNKDDFDILYSKYINNCKNIKKLAYNTILRKEKTYNKYLKNKVKFKVINANKESWAKFIDKANTTNKQKNEIIKQLRAFYNWLIQEEISITNPMTKIQKYKIEKREMKFWIPEELKAFMKVVNEDIKSDNILIKKKAYLIRTLVIIGFSLGNRIGESRALTFDCINKNNNTLTIKHSINYDTKSNDFLSSTKTYESQRTIDITDTLINAIDEYKNFLIHELNYPVKENSIILFNYSNNKPYSDVALRKQFYYYCEKAKVTKIRMYDLRHTYAATMMSEGKEAYLFSRRMGHKNIDTTINIYGHLSNKIKKELANSTDKYF